MAMRIEFVCDLCHATGYGPNEDNIELSVSRPIDEEFFLIGPFHLPHDWGWNFDGPGTSPRCEKCRTKTDMTRQETLIQLADPVTGM